jgi:dipeptidyl aminopeptidase/acylaminoacyl peptidase
LLIHGDRDTICPLEQAEQWFTALTVLGKEPVWLILEGEGHDLAREARPASRIARLTAIAEWFERHLARPALQPTR